MRTLIANGTIVNADATTQADVVVDGEQVALIGRDWRVALEPMPTRPSMPAASG